MLQSKGSARDCLVPGDHGRCHRTLLPAASVHPGGIRLPAASVRPDLGYRSRTADPAGRNLADLLAGLRSLLAGLPAGLRNLPADHRLWGLGLGLTGRSVHGSQACCLHTVSPGYYYYD